jgi:hypothetical protein
VNKSRCINATPQEAKALHEGAAAAIARPVEWNPIEAGLNLDFSGLVVEGDERYGWALLSLSGDGAWDARTDREFCPYGRVGDVLEFREMIYPTSKQTETGVCRAVKYKADDSIVVFPKHLVLSMRSFCWASSPRWAIRTRRVIASIDVIRVEEMTEGLACKPDFDGWAWLIGLKAANEGGKGGRA